MEQQITRLTEEQFDNKYELIENHIDDNASFNGCMFETYGDELLFVKEMVKQNRVITIIESDCEECDEFEEDAPMCLYYVSGYHFVNRLGFLITKEPITEEFEVKID